MSKLTTEEHQARLEDLQWLVETGEHLAGAAMRLGLTVDGLWAWCKRHHHQELYQLLAERSHHHELPTKNANRIYANHRRTAA